MRSLKSANDINHRKHYTSQNYWVRSQQSIHWT